MRAIFSSFDHFMVMFIALLGVVWSTVFMPLLGGPLHRYETRAIGAGWQSLRTGEAASLGEAFQVATALPAEAVFPSAHAQEMPPQLVLAGPEPAPAAQELLGAPDSGAPRPRLRRTPPAVVQVQALPEFEPIAESTCDAAALEPEHCASQALSATT